jgi:hypothetical protein
MWTPEQRIALGPDLELRKHAEAQDSQLAAAVSNVTGVMDHADPALQEILRKCTGFMTEEAPTETTDWEAMRAAALSEDFTTEEHLGKGRQSTDRIKAMVNNGILVAARDYGTLLFPRFQFKQNGQLVPLVAETHAQLEWPSPSFETWHEWITPRSVLGGVSLSAALIEFSPGQYLEAVEAVK